MQLLKKARHLYKNFDTGVIVTMDSGYHKYFNIDVTIRISISCTDSLCFAGIATALGLCTGLMVHITAVTLGISAMIYKSSLAFSIVKYAGATYLLFLTFQSFKENESVFRVGNEKSGSLLGFIGLQIAFSQK